MKKAVSLLLFIMLSFIMIGCGPQKTPSGGGLPPASNLAKLDLFDAKALVLASVGGSAEKLYKITNDNTLVQVESEDAQGNAITGKLNFTGLYDVNDRYFLMKLYTESGNNVRQEGFLVSKDDGKATLLVDLPTKPTEYTTPEHPQLPPAQTDAEGNLYFIEEDNRQLVKLKVAGGKVVSRSILVKAGRNKPMLKWFQVDSAGNVLYLEEGEYHFLTAEGRLLRCYREFGDSIREPHSFVLTETGDERGRRFFFQWRVEEDSAEIYQVPGTAGEDGNNVSTLFYDTVVDLLPDPDMWYLMWTANTDSEVVYINDRTYIANSEFHTLIEFYNPLAGPEATPRYVYFDEAGNTKILNQYTVVNFVKQTDTEVLFFGRNGPQGIIAWIDPESENYNENVIPNCVMNKAIILENGEIMVTAEYGSTEENIIGIVQPGAIETIEADIEVEEMISL